MSRNPNERTALEAWDLYHRRGAIAHHLLRPSTARAWIRSHELRASPYHMQAERLTSLETERLLMRKQALIQAAKPYLSALSLAAGQQRHAAMLGDDSATVLDVVGDPATLLDPQGFPGPGSILHEALGGANGIGTPLAEGGYSELIGSEHFMRGFHAFTCQGIPIWGPFQELVGVLSTSVRQTEASHMLRDMMLVASKGITAELILRELENLTRQLVLEPAYPSLKFEALRQDIIQFYAAGKISVELASFQLGQVQNHHDFASALELLKTADQAIEKFQNQSRLCLNLVSSIDHGQPEEVTVINELDQITDLLATEISIRKMKLVVHIDRDLKLQIQRRYLQKQLFQMLQAGLDKGECGILILTAEQTERGLFLQLGSIWENKERHQSDADTLRCYVPVAAISQAPH